MVIDDFSFKKDDIVVFLERHFTNFFTLKQYVDYITLKSPWNSLSSNLDLLPSHGIEEFIEFLQSTLVGFYDFSFPKFGSYTPQCSQSELVLHVTQHMFQNESKYNNNLLTKGFSTNHESFQATHVNGERLDLVSTFPNGSIHTLTSKNWKVLLQTIGCDAMYHLLYRGSIFSCLPNHNYLQVTGVPIYAFKNKLNYSEKKRKHDSSNHQNGSHKKIRIENPWNKITIKRFRIFYKFFNKHLKKDRFFNCGQITEETTVCWLQWMFPHQFGLPSVFTEENFENKASSLSFEKLDIPKRLLKAAPLIRNIAKSLRQVSLLHIFNFYCPKNANTHLPKSENSKVVAYSLKVNQVYAFLRSVILKVFPKAVWGTTHVFNLVMQKLKTFLQLTRFETITLHFLMQKIPITSISWIRLGENDSKKLCLSDYEKRKQIFSEFMYWFFNTFVVSLLQSFFYCTESLESKNATCYFRKDVWTSLSTPFLKSVKDSTYVPIERHELFRDLVFPPATIRLIPKRDSFRLITNLRRKHLMKKPFDNHGIEHFISTNQLLQPLASVLKLSMSNYESRANEPFSYRNVFSKILCYKEELQRHSWYNRKKYFVRIDIKGCYDNIKQDLMSRITKIHLKDPEYVIRKYCLIHKSQGQLVKQYVNEAQSYFDLTPFERLVSSLANRMKDTLFIDNVEYWTKTFDELYDILEKHISQNIVKIGRKYYRQTQGIPQGSVISSYLCYFYMQELIEDYLLFTKRKGSTLIRVVDDFLFITVHKKAANRFLSISSKGFTKYNFNTSNGKTLINFKPPSSFKERYIRASNLIPFYGFYLHTRSLHTVYCCSTNFQTLYDASTVELCRGLGNSLINKILRSGFASFPSVFVNAQHNSCFVIFSNIYNLAFGVSLRLQVHLKRVVSVFNLRPLLLTRMLNMMIKRLFRRVCSLSGTHNKRPFLLKEVKWALLHGFLNAVKPSSKSTILYTKLMADYEELRSQVDFSKSYLKYPLFYGHL
ncbi:telomerase reverse transcriptase 1 protein Trt1 [Schizosaccharomyces cryophilus OY26]|uniref:Telomerase reverse transcriptase n=1 Tax=Schizosaccharomyces cryophilus (strain OY26 / ATCC MYA-4695 / CBS 11777 / NBRC 106824 / NRRL Y48691) TaxID=653667 RepID=S9X776_SCHCR|nr:telomerase reverse transcriptase 1 protein Trt1 [Schizosaccharomyces cryophilus OY26]EPY49626.1 telomerase reverse transcriptase 1 protein Trt1 [Schizosaccharomyces cryophilus OY26]